MKSKKNLFFQKHKKPLDNRENRVHYASNNGELSSFRLFSIRAVKSSDFMALFISRSTS